MTIAPQTGLRERKKQETRQRIADAARRLFVERSFEAVTVAEVARAADVSEKTVYNYFPRKEDLFYSGMETFEEDLLAAIQGREPGQSLTEAFRGFLLQQRGLLGRHDPDATKRLAAMTRMITESTALLGREREILDRYTSSLAELIAEERKAGPDDVEPWVVANALMGVHRSLIDYSRRRILAGVPNRRLAREMPEQLERALGALERGLRE
jgi:AcrR family transcriptional regulator